MPQLQLQDLGEWAGKLEDIPFTPATTAGFFALHEGYSLLLVRGLAAPAATGVQVVGQPAPDSGRTETINVVPAANDVAFAGPFPLDLWSGYLTLEIPDATDLEVAIVSLQGAIQTGSQVACVCGPAAPTAFQITAFSLTPSPVLEVGDTLTTPPFTATYNTVPTSVLFDDSDGNPQQDFTGTPNSFASVNNYTETGLNDTVVFTLTAHDGTPPDTANVTAFWRPKVFVGSDTPVLVGGGSEALIESLAQQPLQATRAGTYNVTVPVGETAYYAAPQSYGVPAFQIGAFPGGFIFIGSYLVTNTFGVAVTYDLYRSTNQSLGPVVIQVS